MKTSRVEKSGNTNGNLVKNIALALAMPLTNLSLVEKKPKMLPYAVAADTFANAVTTEALLSGNLELGLWALAFRTIGTIISGVGSVLINKKVLTPNNPAEVAKA